MTFHKTVSDHFEKITYFKVKINESSNEHDLAAFFEAAHHLVDIMVKDKHCEVVSVKQREKAITLSETTDFKICKAICNEEKHFKPEKREPTIYQKVSADAGWGKGRWGVGIMGTGELIWKYFLKDGTEEEVIPLVTRIYEGIEILK